MLNLGLPPALRRVLCIGAHCDDVEIGCGATLLAIARARPDVELTIAVFTSEAGRDVESTRALQELLGTSVQWRVQFATFRNSYFPAQWSDIKQHLERIRQQSKPDLIFTHCRDDLHQDHRTLAELTWNVFRDHWVLEYEIPKYDGDLGRPNVFVPLDDALVERKVETLLRCFRSQADKPWFTADTFRGLMRLRGIECQSPGGFAEAFFSRKLTLRP
ncbi:MAG: GlcNAc-PI de-N-acetylase [Rhodanobacteraceae bacterium]